MPEPVEAAGTAFNYNRVRFHTRGNFTNIRPNRGAPVDRTRRSTAGLRALNPIKVGGNIRRTSFSNYSKTNALRSNKYEKILLKTAKAEEKYEKKLYKWKLKKFKQDQAELKKERQLRAKKNAAAKKARMRHQAQLRAKQQLAANQQPSYEASSSSGAKGKTARPPFWKWVDSIFSGNS